MVYQCAETGSETSRSTRFTSSVSFLSTHLWCFSLIPDLIMFLRFLNMAMKGNLRLSESVQIELQFSTYGASSESGGATPCPMADMFYNTLATVVGSIQPCCKLLRENISN